MAKNKTGVDTKGVSNIESAITEFYRFIDSSSGSQIDAGKVVVSGNYLHQDGDGMSEKESAEFERDNKATFDVLQALQSEISNIFRKHK